MTLGIPNTEKRGLSRTEWRFVAAAVCALFFCFEIAIGASFAFAGLTVLFLAIMGFAIQALGGVATLFGVAFATLAAQHIVVSQVIKAYMGQSPDSRLDAPIMTMLVYCVAACGYLAAAKLHQKFKFRGGKPLFAPTVDPQLLARMAIAAAVLTGVRWAFSLGGDTEEGFSTGGILGLVRQLNILDLLAPACATASIVVASRGKRFFGWLTMITIAGPLLFGLVGGHRAGFINPIVTIVITAWAFGFRYRIRHVAFMAFAAWFFVFVFSPFAIAIRSVARTGNFVNDLNLSINAFFERTADQASGDVEEDRRKTSPEIMATRYFGVQDYAASTLLERFAMIKPTDSITKATLEEGTTEFATITPGFLMSVPSFILPDKPIISTGNMIAHRVPGWVGAEDYHTQITFGIVADSFGSFGWYGAFAIPMIITFTSLMLYGAIVSLGLRNNVYAIALVPRYIFSVSTGTVQHIVVNSLQVTYIIIIGLLLVHGLAKLGELKYLHPRSRRAPLTNLPDPR